MNKIISKTRFAFSFFKQQANISLIRSSIYTPLSVGKVFVPQAQTYNTTKLASGITVLTESVSVPSTVHLGIFFDIGTRDETTETSGAMLSLKNTYLKTAINTSETVNYGITQMSGGHFEMDYNRENSYYHASCLSHDVVDVFSMVADSAFEPKNVVSSSVGIYKNQKSHKLESHLGGNEVFTDAIYATAYGKNNLGLPIQGVRSNVSYLTAYVIQKFQADNINPNRIVISASGVEDHEQFVELVNQKLSGTILPTKSTQRQAAKYVGGEVRNLVEANNVHVVLAFEGANHKNALPLLIAQEVLGYGRRSGRINRSILKNVFVDNSQTINTNYSDTGLFGLKVSGSASHAKDIVNIAAKELNNLRNISTAEFEIAKEVLKGKINKNSTNTCLRLEERTKSLYYNGKTNEQLVNDISSINLDQVSSAVEKVLKSPLTFVVKGGEISHIPSYDALSKLFN